MNQEVECIEPPADGAPIPLGTDRDAWLAERRKYLTASDVAAVLGLSPWKSRRGVLEEKLGLYVPEDIGRKPAVAAGRHLEAGIFAWACEDRGWEGELNGPNLVVSPVVPQLAATPDGYAVERRQAGFQITHVYEARLNVEIKNVKERSRQYWKAAGREMEPAWLNRCLRTRIARPSETLPLPLSVRRAGTDAFGRGWAAPLHYWTQLQCQLHCTGLDEGWIVACIGGTDRVDLQYVKDLWFEAWMLEEARKFWADVEAAKALDA